MIPVIDIHIDTTGIVLGVEDGPRVHLRENINSIAFCGNYMNVFYSINGFIDNKCYDVSKIDVNEIKEWWKSE